MRSVLYLASTPLFSHLHNLGLAPNLQYLAQPHLVI